MLRSQLQRRGNKGVRVVKNLRSNKKSYWRRLQIDPFSKEVPLLVDETVSYIEEHGLEEEGVFRSPGVKREVQSVLQAYSKGRKVDLNKYGPQTASSVLKLFLQNLADPLLTNELTECFFDAIEEKVIGEGEDGKPSTKLSANLGEVKGTIKLLPEGNRMVLQRLCSLLRRISTCQASRVTSSDLATCLVPVLFNLKEDSLEEARKAHILLETFIDAHSVLFGEKELGLANRQFKQKLYRKSMALTSNLKAKLRELDDQEDLEDEEEEAEEEEARGLLQKIPLVNKMVSAPEYMKVLSQNREILVVGTSVRREWFLIVFYVLCSLVPVVYSLEVWTAILSCISLYAVYQSIPVKEVWTLTRAENQVKQELKVGNKLRRSNMYELKRIQDVVVEEHETKRGAYRTVLIFDGGIVVPLTRDFFYSNRGKPQREVAAEILKFCDVKAA